MRFLLAATLALWAFSVQAQPIGPSSGGGGGGSVTPSSVAAAGAPTGYINVTAPAYGAQGNTLSYADGIITSGTNIFSSNNATFTVSDVGKSIAIDYAGVAGVPLTTTISGFTSAHIVTLAANASTTTGPIFTWSCIPSAAGTGYVPNNTITLTGGTPIAGANTVCNVILTTVVSAVQNANGSGGATNTGGASGSCQVQGTTGAGAAKFTLNVTLTGGAISAIGTFVNSGSYTTNPTSLVAEPVTPVNGCTGLAGATLTIAMGVLVAQPSTAGSYSAYPSQPILQGSTSGVGTGATFTAQTITTGAFMYGSDDTTALTAAFSASNTLNASGQSSCIFFPAGSYFLSSPLPLWTTNGCVIGQGNEKTWLLVSPALNGDVISWSEAWGKSNQSVSGGLSNWTGQTAGPIIRDITIAGDRNSTNNQNAVMFYDRNDFVEISRTIITNFNGSCFSGGTTKNTSQAFLRESNFSQVKMFYCGNSTHPAMLFDSAGSGDATNEIKMDAIDIFAFFGHGAVFRSNGTPARAFYISKLRVEGIQFDPVTIAADNLVIGDSTATGNINSWSCVDCEIVSVYPGQSSIRIDASGGSTVPYYVSFRGRIGGGSPQGRGLLVNYGRDSDFYFLGMNTEDVNITLASTAGNINVNAPSGAQSLYTYSLAGGTLASYPLYFGNTQAQTGYFDLAFPGSNATSGNVPGQGAVSIQPNRGANAYNTASGSNSVAIGGIATAASGANAAAVGGNGSIMSGTASGAVGGIRTTDRTWYGARCHASGTLTDFNGDANYCEQILRCQAAATNGSTCRATADNAAAGANNVANIPNNAAYSLDVKCSAIDRATPGNNFSWKMSDGLLTRGANAASTSLVVGTTVTHSNGSVAGLGIAITADTTNGGLNITFTSPATNSDLYDASCHVQTQQTQ